MTLQEFINNSIFVAGVQNADAQAEALVPIIFQRVALRYAGSFDGRSLLRRTLTVSLTNGVGEIPSAALTSCWTGATVNVPAEPTVGPLMSFTPWDEFLCPLDVRLGYWTIRVNDTMYWINPGETYDASSGRTGDVELNITSVPDVPATAGATIDAPDEFLSDATEEMAKSLVALNRPTPTQ